MGRKSQKLPGLDLIIVLDFGGSKTKIIYQAPGGLPQLLCMEPEVAMVPRASILNYERNKLGGADPKDVAWVSVGDEYYAVGYLAASQFSGNAGLSELKYERALYKTLAAIWVAKEALLSLSNRFSVGIGVLLPPGEYQNSSRFEQLLRESLANYQTPTGILNVKLGAFDCKPEGGGIYMVHRKRHAIALKQKIVAVVMLGYRNASVLVSYRGNVGELKTSELGFIRLVERVMKRTSGQTAERLASAIALAGEDVNPKPLLPLALSTKADRRREEVQEIATAIKESRPEYVLSLKSWLREVLPKDLDEVVLCGGTAFYLIQELSSHFAWIPTTWDADIEIPSELDTEQMGNRLADVYGMFLYFQGVVAKQLEKLKAKPTDVSKLEAAPKQEVVSHG